MGSSEIVDSGRFSGGKYNFSQTCSLLSQYLKENGSFGELTLGLTQNSESEGAPTETMNLLSMIESAQSSGPRVLNGPPTAKPKAETAPMTIFYAGQVIVFNDFPADKANEIMMLARQSSTAINHPDATFAPPHATQSPGESTTPIIPNIVPTTFGIQMSPHHSAQPSLDSDLPIARKNSLARFLEKRRDRVTANTPYPASKQAEAPPPKRIKTEAWLGLAPRLPL